MAALVLAEHDGTLLRPAVANVVTAAAAFSGRIDVLVIGADVAAIAEAVAGLEGVGVVLVADAPHLAHPLAETEAPLVADVVREGGYDAVVAAATTYGKNLVPRVAALLDVAPVSDVTAVIAPNTFERPIYAGNAIATVVVGDPIRAVTIRPTAFPPAVAGDARAEVRSVAAGAASTLARYVGADLVVSGRPDLTQAKVVVAGGRGVQSKENFALIERLADTLGAAVGATRAAVDAGYIANDAQVGQTGKVVAPSLYIAVGLSGAIQHVAGIKDSQVIVAINKDEDAPIFQVADYALVADLFDAVPELIRILEE